MSRSAKLFSLDVGVIDALAARSKETGEPMSRIVEAGIRMALALPAITPAEASEEAELSATRSERVVLEVLKSLGPGPHWTTEWCKRGLTVGVVERSLHALVRRGDAFLWGAAKQLSDGSGYILAWDAQAPLERVREIVDLWKSKGGTQALPATGSADSWSGFKLINYVRQLVACVDDLEPIRTLVSEAVGLPPESLDFMNTRELIAERDALERTRLPNGLLPKPG
jgi:hypothetical protein